MLKEARFTVLGVSVSADTKWRPADVRSHGAAMIELLDGPFGGDLVDREWAGAAAVARMRDGVAQWMHEPGAFFANVHVEVLGRSPSPARTVAGRA